MEPKKTLKTTTYANEISKNQNNVLTGKQYLLLIPLTKFYCVEENITKLKTILEGRSTLSLRLVDWFVTNYSKKNLVMYNLKKIKKEYSSNKINNLENIKIKISDDNDSGIDDEEYFTDYFNVFSNYRAQLKSLNKKNFDPFCRRSRIKFYYGKSDNDFIITTVGQLNFFKWAIENYILEYVAKNITEIEEDMNQFTNIKKNNLDKTKKKKKKEKKEPKTKTNTKKNETVLQQQQQSQKPTRRKRKELSSSVNKSFVIHNLKAVIDFN